MSATCYHCDKGVKEPVLMTCIHNFVEWTATLHDVCVGGYRRSLAKFGSKERA